MNVLGYFIGEYPSVALVRDGKLLGASYEERFHRKKALSGYPYRAVQHVLASNGMTAKDIDRAVIASVGKTGLEYALIQRLNTFEVHDFIREAHDYYRPVLFEKKNLRYLDVFRDKIDPSVYPKDIADRLLAEGETTENTQTLRQELVRRDLGRPDLPVSFLEHHLSHALFAILFAPTTLKKYLVFSADSFGDDSNCDVFRVDGDRIERLHHSDTQNLGRLYRNITLLLGMKPYQHEYKVMGLAPYAAWPYAEKVKAIFEQYMTGFDGAWIFRQKPKDNYFTFRDQLEGYRFDSIAAGLQLYFEERLEELFAYYIERNADCEAVLFSGGLSMNVKANLRLAELAERHGMRFYAAPSGDDNSHSVSAAYSAWLTEAGELTPKMRSGILDRLDLGYRFSSQDEVDLVAWAKGRGWSVSPMKPEAAAAALDSGRVLALCHGCAEFGARALGFRSIIADPRDPDTIRRINLAIKQRDFWMPFAPAVLDGHEQTLFQMPEAGSHRFMACAAHTTERGQRELRAAIHPYDATGRPQVVQERINPLFARVISAFGERTGTYAVLNTSLNLHGYPIVNNAADLIFVLENSDLDGVVTEQHLLLRAAS